MNWTLVLLLSLFGFAMAFATVFVIPSTTEPLFWLAIFVVCAYVIARRAPGRFFLHGLMVGIVNSVWITSAHLLFFDQYVANHPQEAQMMTKMPLAPKVMMAVTGPIVGVVSGVILGLFAMIAGALLWRGRSRQSRRAT
jgi:hypothetical protein